MGITNFDIVQANLFLGGMFATQGNVYYVNPRTGSDNNSGKSPTNQSTGRDRNDGPMKTVTAAYNRTTTGQNDIVVLQAAGASVSDTTSLISETLTWSKNNTHLVGLGADSMVSQRQRIGLISTATGVTSLINVTGTGCKFQNIHFFHGDINDGTSIGPAIQVTGNRNVFDNCHIAGMGHSSLVGAGGTSLKIDGGSENFFKHCTIGLDTIARDASAEGEIWLDGAATRNIFEDCLITAFISNAGYEHVVFEDATAIDRYVMFKNCMFYSISANNATPQADIMEFKANLTQGHVILMGCGYATDDNGCEWSAGEGSIRNTAPDSGTSASGGEGTIL
jgi:hypothetical protein